MWETVKEWLGIKKLDKYVSDYIEDTNMRAMRYMCSFVIFVEAWMILRIIREIMFGSEQRSPEWIAVHLRLYIVLFAASILMMWFSLTWRSGKKRSYAVTAVWKLIYSLICIIFGIYVSYLDYSKGEQIMSFITMILFVACLLSWRPYVSVIILTLSFAVFYKICDAARPATVATDVNMFTTWVAMIMISLGNYRQRLSEAIKDKGLEDASIHDELTGISNMYHFRRQAEPMLESARDEGRTLSLLYLDIVNFKTYNERYGFTEGNELLKTYAGMIQEVFPEGETARLADDHFVVLTGEEAPERKISLLQERLVEIQRDTYLTLKAGIYITDGRNRDGSGTEDINLLCDRAGFAVKSIKSQGDRTYCFYDEGLYEKQKRKQYILNNIDKAVSRGHIKVYYQPIVEVKTGKVSSLEALARWDDPDRGLLSPGEFIDTLEEFRQIHKLDIHVIELVCRDYNLGRELNRTVLPVSINLSRLDFELCDIAGEVARLSSEYGVPEQYLDIEITESALSRNRDELDRAMESFRGAKHTLWLDDFGAGYSSFNALKDYSFDVLKIDMKFLEDFGKNDRFEPILHSIIDLCRKLNMISLTEGVETREQLEFLKRCGCDRVQGYLFSRPVPMEELQGMFKQNKLEAETCRS
jgi:diguanylate cyclase (GGDEF)-like protein